MSTLSKNSTEVADVLIIGGGLSGLSALKKIVENDSSTRVELYEAQKRIGGRVSTENIKGVNLDKGASWIGPTQTRMYELLKEFNIPTVPQYDTGKNIIAFQGADNYKTAIGFSLAIINILLTIFYYDSFTCSTVSIIASIVAYSIYMTYLCEKRVKFLIKKFSGTIPPISLRCLYFFGIAQLKLDNQAKKINLEDPYSSPNAVEYDSMSLLAWAEHRLGLRETSIAFKTFQAATDVIFGCDMADISVLHTLFYIKSAGNLDLLLNTRGGAQQDRISGGSSALPLALEKKFSKYIHLNSPVAVIDNSSTDIVKVQFENGTQRHCKRLIFAIPPAAIAQTIQFTNLPKEKLAMLKAMKAGTLAKCFTVFKTPFWRESKLSGQVLSPERQPSLIYDVSSDQNGILLAFLIFPHAPSFRELPFEQRQEYMLNHLSNFFDEKSVRDQFVFYSDENFVDEKYMLGCPVGCFAIDGWKKHGKYWKKPIDNLFWASTETATVWNGYMEGAVRSGERAAQEVIASFGSAATNTASTKPHQD